MCIAYSPQIGSTDSPAVRMLDFATGPQAGCWVSSSRCGANTASDQGFHGDLASGSVKVEDRRSRMNATIEHRSVHQRTPSINARVSTWPLVVAMHPCTEELVVGCMGGAMLGVAPWFMGSL